MKKWLVTLALKLFGIAAPEAAILAPKILETVETVSKVIKAIKAEGKDTESLVSKTIVVFTPHQMTPAEEKDWMRRGDIGDNV